MSTHAEFHEYLTRNRASMSPEAFDAANRPLCWLFLLESGEAGAEAQGYAKAAMREFMELRGEPPLHP